MNLTHYTTNEEVRAVIGVSEEEITDSDLALSIWSTVLEMKLNETSELVISTYDSIASMQVADRSSNQQKFYLLTRMYSAYAVGEELLATQPMFSFKRITDGKAEAERFDKWEDVKIGVIKGASVAKKRLMLALGLLNVGFANPAATVMIPILGTGIASDPVTGV